MARATPYHGEPSAFLSNGIDDYYNTSLQSINFLFHCLTNYSILFILIQFHFISIPLIPFYIIQFFFIKWCGMVFKILSILNIFVTKQVILKFSHTLASN